MLRLPPVEHRADEPVTAQPGEKHMIFPKRFHHVSTSLSCSSNVIYRLSAPAYFPAKEIQLMHRAPVVGIVVLDGQGAPLPEPLEVAHDLARSPEMQGSHHLLVISEEQFKVRITHSSDTHTHTQLT